ncbi:CHAT domain-containing protein [Candidatus Accumulibacter sp. ACC003]|uniref:CHAT domain-containing protein n=1 Tax=Candidatus Accumulibacter sp. ACC003 TaxID=2823334 RepID=UPI0025C335DC|nr:CHAT domain-containing protein [Candidatus Accumulibacter sp. ACC003]
MIASVEPIGTDVLCRSTGTATSELRLDGEQLLGALADWSERYARAVANGMAGELLAIGREMFDRLDGNGWASAWAQATGPRTFEVRVDDFGTYLARALLDAPWELLASRDGHLAGDHVQLFELARRVGVASAPLAARYDDLQLMFMAAAPQGASVLDFEAEEAAILEATKGLPLHLVVEESGAAAFLGERLRLDGPFEALHLSCHGTIDPTHGSVLLLEDTAGDLAPADAGEVVALLGEPGRTPLVFLSACRTAEDGEARGEGQRRFEPFVRDLTRAGVANVLGWDGSVFDADAMAFATVFYRQLAGRENTVRAAAVARHEVRRKQIADPQCGWHWHLARLYLGPGGGGALAARGQAKRTPAGVKYEEQFLDAARSKIPVAGRNDFVGRRRETQAVLRAFRDGAAGVLIHGMANLGKSSLAARIASRMSNHRTVVVFEHYDALAIFDRVVEALPPPQRRDVRATWRDAVIANADILDDALETLLAGPLHEQPMLLIVDDLERVLETPLQSDAPTPVAAAYRAPLAAILSAFSRTPTASRLLLTSRYRFTLSDARGRELAAQLRYVPLRPMDEGDQYKQLRVALRGAQRPHQTIDETLLRRALNVAGGNPGLQALLTRPIVAGETLTASRALESIEHFQHSGVPTTEIGSLIAQGISHDAANAVVAFFKRMAFDVYRAALSDQQASVLRGACVFVEGMPVPRTAIEAAGGALGVLRTGNALDRLLGLGLVDDWGALGGAPHAAVNPLARPLSKALDEATVSRLADAVLPVLGDTWRRKDGSFSWDARAVEVARLELAAVRPDAALLDAAAESAGRHFFQHHADAQRALDLVLEPALVFNCID